LNSELEKGTPAAPRSFREVAEGIYRSFRRPRVTVIIISALLALFLSGLLIPQKTLFTSREQFEQWNADHPLLSLVITGLKLNEIYVAPVTVVFLALFFLNLLAVLAHRVPHVLRRAYVIDRRSAVEGLEKVKNDPQAHTIVLRGTTQGAAGVAAGQAASFFRKRFWSVMTADDGRSFIAVRNRLSPLGFLLFHVSFFLCLAGGLLVMYTRFSGNLLLTEGEEFQSNIAQFRKISREPKIFHALPELRIALRKVFPTYEGSTGTDLKVSMQIQYFKEAFEAVSRINEPIRKGAISILPENIGISPLFVLHGPGGAEASGGYFILNVLKGEEDSFQFPDLPYTVFVRFYPDFTEEAGKPVSRSLDIRNPVFHIRVQEGERTLAEGYRRPGEGIRFGAHELSCSEIRYWVDLLVVREYGDTPIAVGFILGAVGLIMRLIFYQKTVRVHIEELDDATVLYVGGNGEYYQHTFREELERLAAALTNALQQTREGGTAL